MRRVHQPHLLGLLCFGLLALLPDCVLAATLPSGFVETYLGYSPGAVGVTFDELGTMYQWDRDGRVWIYENDVKLATPLIDISDEVGSWRDHGMLGFALDPNFRQNGYIYLMYVVDHHHLARYGTPSYNPAADEYFQATIGRITRYTARASDGFHSVDPASRTILVGETASTGFPITSVTHGVGTLLFGIDGTLLASCGDGAGTSDSGSDPLGYYAQALAEGIIRPEENVGAFRSQMLESLSGKILRVDPLTGDAIPSNPFYDSAQPRSARSRVWALGLRQPFRMSLKPNSGSHNRGDGRPGVILLGDVGEYVLEEMDVVTGPGQNFGWPLFEGLTVSQTFDGVDHPNRGAPNPLYGIGGCTQQYFTFRDLLKEATLGAPSWPNPCNSAQQVPASIPHFTHARPVLDWMHGSGPSRTGIFNGTNAGVINIGVPGSPVSGPQFGGNCAVGGAWYAADSFPAQYRNTYFLGDLGGGWIRNVVLDSNNAPVTVRNFASGVDEIVAMAAHPTNGALYYVNVSSGVYKISYGGNAPPKAVASANINYGAGPLTVNFTGNASSDPEGLPLTYRWNFNDGSPISTTANPSHTFNAPPGVPTRYDVTLTVTDSAGDTNVATLIISVNNTPPVATIISPAVGTFYPITMQSVYDLIPNITDTEHSTNQLSVLWRTDLHHNEHVHPGQNDTNWFTTTVITPLGCDGQIYYYRVRLTVTDPAGLSTSTFVDLFPACSNTPPAISALADQVTNENVPVGPLAFTIGDMETSANVLILSANSSNPTLVPNGNIVFGGSGANRTVTVSPSADQNGVATITVTVSDGQLSASETFNLTVTPSVNTPPTLSDIANRITDEDVSTGGIPFTVGDGESAPGSLVLSGSSSNPSLVPNANILFGGSGANRTVTLTPSANQSGSASITVTVSDGGLTSSDTFELTVNPVNDAPTISSIAHQSISQGTATGAIGFTVGDIDNLAATLTLSGSSSNPTLVPNGNIIFGGSGANRTVTVSPVATQSGTALISVTVQDGTLTASDTFTLTVNSTNAATYLLSEGFEGTGYENSGWIEDGSVNPDYTATVLDGLQSLNIAGSEMAMRSLLVTNRFYLYCQARWRTWTGYRTLITWDDGAWNTVADVFTEDGVLQINHGATGLNGTTPINLNTTYHMWIEWTRGTGNNGTMKLFLSTTGTKPAIPEISIANGNGANPQRMILGALDGSDVIMDKILLDDVEIGSNPGGSQNEGPTISDIPNQTVNEGASTGPIAFTVGDAESSPGSLTLSGSSSNPTLVPNGNIVFAGSGANRTVTLSPVAGQNGSATITVTVSDGQLTATDSFTLTVAPLVNTVPTISDISDRVIGEDSATAAIAFTVGDAETSPGALVVTGSSSNPGLVPNGNIVFGGSGANRTVTLTPLANQFGSATITVTVSDGALAASDTFALTVNPLNDAPTISDIADQTISQGAATGPISLTVADVDNAPSGLTLTGNSSNPSLVPNANIVFGGSGANRTVTVSPVANQFGAATITVTVSDGLVTANDTFLLTVSSTNAPTYRFTEGFEGPGYENSDWLEDGAVNPDYTATVLDGLHSLNIAGSEMAMRSLSLTNRFYVYFQARWRTWTGYRSLMTWDDGAWNTVADVFTEDQVLQINHGAAGLNGTTVINLNSTYHIWVEWTQGTGNNGTMKLFLSGNGLKPTTPEINIANGTGANPQRMILGALDGSDVIVDKILVADSEIGSNPGTPQNQAPTISDIQDETINQGASTGTIAFTVGDAETSPGSLVVTGSSSNPALLPNANIVFGGSGANRTVMATPVSNQNGTATITVTVSDGELTATDTFDLTVMPPVNMPPTISAIANGATDEDTAAVIPFTVGDAETPSNALVVNGTSSNPGLVPTANIVLSGTGADRTATINPLANQFGSATITITVSDGQSTASDTFVLTVNPVNDTPTISNIADQSISEDGGTGTIPFTVADTETPPGNLVMSGSSSNPSLVPSANIVFGGSGANRTLTVTSLPDQFGSATITVTVSDGESSVGHTFQLTVTPVNDLPTISNIADQIITQGGATDTIAFTVGDVETAATSLIVTGSSSNPTLVPNGNIVFGGSGGSRTVMVTPAANQNGAATITITVTDGESSTSDTFELVVTPPVNTPPSISDIADSVMDEDAVAVIPFSVADAETSANALLVSGDSSNPSLVPNANILLGGSGANRTVIINPLSNQFGSTIITVFVSDGVLTASDSFVLTVHPVNDAPTISNIADQTVTQGGATDTIAFTVGDVETAAASLIVTGNSSNPALVPNGNIAFGGSGANRTVIVTPAANQSGSATITVMVSDGESSANEAFELVVTPPVNTPPTLSSIADQSINEDDSTGTISFTVADAETAAADLALSGTSSNPGLVPNGNIVFDGTGADRTLTVTSLADQFGSATITVTVSDGESSSSHTFNLTVTPVNDVPTVSNIADQSINEDSTTGTIPFTVADIETAASELLLSGNSSNPALVPNGNIAFGGSGANRTVTVSPLPDQFGSATVTVTVSDGESSANHTFNLTVTPVNDAPTVSNIADQSINEDASTGTIPFTVGDPETPASALLVTGTSSNPSLVPNANIVFGGTGADQTLTVVPLADQFGSVTITVTVSDGELAASATFMLNVNPLNDLPTISNIADQSANEDSNTGAIPLTVADTETAASDLTLIGNSSNPALVPNGNIAFGGSGANRTVTVSPLPDQFGSATITVTLSDGASTVSDTFELAVNPVNDAPTISNIPDQTISQGGNTGTIAFSLGDVDNTPESLALSAGSSNPTLVPNNNIIFAGSDSNRTVTVTPAPAQSGITTITVTVSDGSLTATDTFVLTVNSNTAPTYLLREGFEGPGYENTGWVQDGAANPNYTTVVLDGLQSLRFSGSQMVRRPFVAQDRFYMYFRVRWRTLVRYRSLITWDDNEWNTTADVFMENRVLQLNHGSASAIGTTMINVNKTYHIWVEWTRGSANDGTMALFLSTNADKPATPEVSITNGSGDNPQRMILGALSGSDVIMDKILVDDVEITAFPPPEHAFPATLSLLSHDPDGSVVIRIAGKPGSDYFIEASDDFQTWDPIGSAMAEASGVIIFTDPEAPTHNQRFYRAWANP